jgi:NAD(P)-dependent dehydrogenase (short-subunit alcohol dehydrogenase family)
MHVLVHGRNSERARAVAGEIQATGGRVQTYLADLGSLELTRALADRVSSDHLRFIGWSTMQVRVRAAPAPQARLGADGHELRFRSQLPRPHAVGSTARRQSKSGGPARIVSVASAAQAPIDFADLRMDHHYSGTQAYSRSKFALVAFTFDLAAELADTSVTVNCVHPASLMNTPIVRRAWVPPVSSVATGVRAVTNLAVEPTGAAVTGRYFDGVCDAKAHDAAYDPDVRFKCVP